MQAVQNAIAANEVNAKMGIDLCHSYSWECRCCLWCADGCSAIVCSRLVLNKSISSFTAGAFGLVIANNASISGAEGGCQAERLVLPVPWQQQPSSVLRVGATSSCSSSSHYTKEYDGIDCDPVAGLVEVPLREAKCSRFLTSILFLLIWL